MINKQVEVGLWVSEDIAFRKGPEVDSRSHFYLSMKGEAIFRALIRHSTHILVGITGSVYDDRAGPVKLFFPACTLIFPGHCTVIFPPSIVIFAPPAVDKLIRFAAAQSICAFALITLISSRACTFSSSAWA